MASAIMSMATLPSRLTTQQQSVVHSPLSCRPVALISRRSVGRAFTVRAGPLDRFSKQTKKAAGGKFSTDKGSKEIGTPESGFTRNREVIAGRLAMTGFFAETIGELFTGKGAVGQLSLETLLPRPLIAAVVAGIVVFNFATALNPAGPTFDEDNQRDVRKRPSGGVQKPSSKNLVENPKETLGVTSFGFTKANELFVGRVAMIGFAASLIGEFFQAGKGPLGQLGIPMPAYAEYAAFGLAGWILFFFAAAVGTGNFPGETETGDDIY